MGDVFDTFSFTRPLRCPLHGGRRAVRMRVQSRCLGKARAGVSGRNWEHWEQLGFAAALAVRTPAAPRVPSTPSIPSTPSRIACAAAKPQFNGWLGNAPCRFINSALQPFRRAPQSRNAAVSLLPPRRASVVL
jgi:hypothetical protein